MFWHQSANFREPKNTKDHKSKMKCHIWDPLWSQTPCRWISGAETCRGDTYHELCFMNCILLSVFIGQYNKHKKMHKMSNIKFTNESLYVTVIVLYL